MAPIVRGAELSLRSKKTSAIEAATSSANWQLLNFYTEGFQPGQGLVDDEELGGSRDNNVDPTLPVLALPNPVGAIQIPFDLNQVGFFLQSMWGDPVTTGSGPYTHVFSSGGTSPVLRHFEFPIPSSKFKVCDSFAVSQMQMNLADEDGYRRIDCQLMGRSVRMLTSAVASSTVATPTRQKLPATKGVLKINDVNYGNILGGQVVMANGAMSERYMDDSEWPGAVEIGRPSFTLAPEVRYRSDFDHTLFDGSTPFKVELLYALSGSLSLSIVSQQVIAEPIAPAANGIGAMSITPNFLAAQKVTATTAPMLKATLINAVSAY